MSIAERAREIAEEMKKYGCVSQEIADSLNGKLAWLSEATGLESGKHRTYESLIEQALLAERRLAMESLSNYLRHVGSCRFTFDGQKDSCTCGLFEALRAAAEKEVGK